MTSIFRITLVVLLGGSAGCVVSARTIPPDHGPPPLPPPPDGPPPSSPRPVTREEATRIALSVAADRGHHDLRVKEVERDDGRWEIEIRGRAGGRKSELELEIGTYGEVLKVKEEREDDDDDHDDDD